MLSVLKVVRIVAEKLLSREKVKGLVAFYGYMRRPIRSYSQKGEDLILKSYFSHIRLEEGYYLDIGCFHPKWISNTYLMHRAGWSGTAVDIDEYKLECFEKSRGERVDTRLGAVVGNVDAETNATVYRFRSSTGWSDIDTLDYETACKGRDSGAGDFIKGQINLLPIGTLLGTLPHVDFLNIDIEGLNDEVLLSIDFDKYKIGAILFEDNEFWGGSSAVKAKLKQAGYERLFISGGSVCYALPSGFID